jgi:hypothetical protein
VITLKLVQKYLDFKIGEVWNEVSDELDCEGIRPVTPDAACIKVSKDTTIKKAEEVWERQHEVARRSEEVEYFSYEQLFISRRKSATMSNNFIEISWKVIDGNKRPIRSFIIIVITDIDHEDHFVVVVDRF